MSVTSPPPWNDAPAPTRFGTAAAVFITSGPPMQYPWVPIFFALLTSFCASRNAMNATASLSAAPGALIEPISGASFARSSGFPKLNFEGSAMTGALATR